MIKLSDDFYDDDMVEDYFVPSMMKRCWAVNLEIVSEIDRVCRENDIKYFLWYGSLLGAVRHKGFIPWDNDMDLCMLRPDYEKFLDIFNSKSRPQYSVVSYANDGYEEALFSKVLLSTVMSAKEEHREDNHSYAAVAQIDIFPLDIIPDSKDIHSDICNMMITMYGLIALIQNEGMTARAHEGLASCEQLFDVPIAREGNIIRNIRAAMEKKIVQYGNTENGLIVSLYAMVNDFTWSIPKAAFDSTQIVRFSECMLPIPGGYDEILTGLYKDWHRLVRIDKSHVYPWGKEFMKISKKRLGIPSYDFSMDDLPNEGHTSIYKLHQIDKINELVEVFNKAMALAENAVSEGDATTGNLLISKCDEIAKTIEALENTLASKRQRVLFLTWKSKYFDEYSRLYEREVTNPNNEVIVAAIPYVHKAVTMKIGNIITETQGYPDGIVLTPIETIDFNNTHFDRIYIQNPYDEYSDGTQVADAYLSKQISKYTDELIYVPFFRMNEFDENDLAVRIMSYYLELPALVRADKIVLHGEWLKEHYVNELTRWAGEDTKGIWENKILVI